MTTWYCQHPDVRLAALEGDGVALQLASRRYFTVSETALVMLEALQEPRTLAGAVDPPHRTLRRDA